MNELIQKNDNRTLIHWKLLASTSALALALSASSAQAGDANRPTIWLELGGQFDRVTGTPDQWSPPALGVLAGSGIFIRKEPASSFGFNGSLAYQPQNSDWSISLSARVGRNHRHQDFHTQTNARHRVDYTTTTRHDENHMILDFSVGKDVGLGLFGKHGNSTIHAGIRIAQFDLSGHDFVVSQPYISFGGNQREYSRTADESWRTVAAGPALSWNGSVALVTGTDDVLSFDWGAKGAVLFARQKMSGDFQTHASIVQSGYPVYFTPIANSVRRSRNVTIPNAQGSAAISFSWPNARLTVGYAADIYWNAVDGGIAARKTINRSFYGPFASISVGIGD
jgi:hypothetical protein